MKVDRHCPRCRAHLYHFVHDPKTEDEMLAMLPLERWPSEAIPVRVEVCCASCGHRWEGRLNREERGYDDWVRDV